MLLLLLACSPTTSDSAVDIEGAPWTWEASGADVLPVMDDSSLEDAVDGALTLLQTIDPRAIHEAFDSATQWGDGACPYVGQHNGQVYYEGGCTASNGAVVSGLGLRGSLHDLVIEGYHHTDWEWFTGYFAVEGPASLATFVGDVSFRDYDADDGRERDIYGYVQGEFHVEGDGVYDTGFLGDDLGVALEVWSQTRGAAPAITWSARLERVPGMVDSLIVELDGDSSCESEPAGTVTARDVNGRWYTATFDGAQCDGCGTLSTDGQADTTLCVDLQHLGDIGEIPWD